MKHLILAAALTAACASGAEAGPCEPGWKSQAVIMAERRDAGQREMLELDALYWSYRVAVQRDISYESLLAASGNWVLTEENKKSLLARVKRHLDEGTARALTAEERRQYEAGKARLRQMGAGAKAPKAALIEARADEATCSVFELEARYWAWAVNTARTTTLRQFASDSRRWPGSNEVNSALVERVRRLVAAGETLPLSAEENARRGAAKEGLKAYIQELRGRP